MADLSEREKSSKVSSCLSRHGLSLATLVLGAAGLATGLGLRNMSVSEDTILLVELPGHVIMHGYSMLLVPLMASGITLGMSSLRQSGSGRILGLAIFFFATMMTLTSIVGCILGRTLRLGHHTNLPITTEGVIDVSSDHTVVVKAVVEFFENLMPENVFLATVMKKELVLHPVVINGSGTNLSSGLRPDLRYKYESNYVGLVVFFVIFGYAIAGFGSRANTIVLFLEEVNMVIMKIMEGLVRILPVGLYFWMLCQGLRTESVGDMLARIGVYLAVFTACQTIYHIVVLPLLYLFIVRKNPIPFHLRLMPVFCLAFGTASSATTLPLSQQIMEEHLFVDQRVTRLVLPLGSVFNLQGSTLGNPLTVFFIAGMQNVDIGIVRTIVLSITNVLMQLAIPSVPGSGMSILWFLHFVGIYRPYVIGVIMAVMWFLERLTSCNNVIADCYVASFVEKLCRPQLNKSDLLQGICFDVHSLQSESGSTEDAQHSLRDLTASVY